MNDQHNKHKSIAPPGAGFEAGALVPVVNPPEEPPDEQQALEAALRGFLGTMVNRMFERLLKRTIDPAALGRRVFVILFIVRHHSVHGLDAGELAAKLGMSKRRFWKMKEEIEREWGFAKIAKCSPAYR